MASTPLTLIIEGEAIPPADFGDAVREFAALLDDIDIELSPGSAPSLQWRIVGLSYRSPAQVEMVAEPRENAPDIGPRVVQACANGITSIERTGKRPAEFNDDALTRLRRISLFTHNGVEGLRVVAPTENLSAVVTRRTAANVDVVLQQGFSLGAVEGRLDALNIHGQPYFTVYDEVTGRAVHCYFERNILAAVLKAVGTKVTVQGQLRRDPVGRPSQIRPVEFFRALGQQAGAVPAQGLAGIFHGLGDSRSYLEIIRGE